VSKYATKYDTIINPPVEVDEWQGALGRLMPRSAGSAACANLATSRGGVDKRNFRESS
jgi:hypothetical protein